MKKYLLLIAIIPVIIFIGLRWNSAPFFSSEKYQCACDKIISDEYTALINHEVANLLHNNSSAHNIINALQQKFPVLKKIAIAYQPAVVRVTTAAHEPICLVNNAWVLTAQQEVFPHTIFSPKVIDRVAHIAAARDDEKNISHAILPLLQGLPADIYGVYNVELVHEHCVRLTDKQQPKFTVLSSVAQDKLPFLLTQCDTIKQTIAARGEFDKGIQWIADTRFAYYIVVYKA